jgi:hypothetical protein
MKASALKTILECELKEHDDFDVLISLSEPSMGARAFTKIKYVGFGIDWESGQFRLEATDEICRRKFAQDSLMPKYLQRFDGRAYYFCSKCGGGTKIAKDDKYCRCCGQRLSDEFIDIT